MSKKPRVSFMTKDVLGEAESSYQKLFTIMTRDGRQVERQEQARGEKVEREASEEQASVSNEKAIDSASGDDKGGELTEINIETRLAEYRERTLDLVMNRVEEALRAPDPQSGQTLAFSEETREKLGQICGFLLDEGAIYPPDMIKFMTTEPNPAGFCALPVDRLIEVSSTLVDIGLRDKPLLSVMFYNNLQVFGNPVSKIFENIQKLRSEDLSLSESLPTVLIKCPGLLVNFDEKDWHARKEWFDFNFTHRTFGEFLITQPQVLFHTMEDIQERFNYVFFEMGLDQKQMMECKLFSHNIDHITIRHEFLKRCGYYRFPDPKKRVINLNPHLDKILDWSDAQFVRLVPGFDLKDYFIFKRIMMQEIEERLEDNTELQLEAAKMKAKRENNQWEYPKKGVFKSWTKKKYFSREKTDLGL